jgi:hypothetical protein
MATLTSTGYLQLNLLVLRSTSTRLQEVGLQVQSNQARAVLLLRTSCCTLLVVLKAKIASRTR